MKNNKRILPAVYDKGIPTDMAIYRCDLFKDAGYGKGDNIYSKSGMGTLRNAEGEEIDKEWKNYCMIDDSSKFAAAVYYHYINKEILKDEKLEKRTAYNIDLWGTSSTTLAEKSKVTNKLVNTSRFELHLLNSSKNQLEENRNSADELKVGDLLCRKKNYKNQVDGHVEFYIGNNKVVSWGEVHRTYAISKKVYKNENNFYGEISQGKEQPYSAIIRFIGGGDDKK